MRDNYERDYLIMFFRSFSSIRKGDLCGLLLFLIKKSVFVKNFKNSCCITHRSLYLKLHVELVHVLVRAYCNFRRRLSYIRHAPTNLIIIIVQADSIETILIMAVRYQDALKFRAARNSIASGDRRARQPDHVPLHETAALLSENPTNEVSLNRQDRYHGSREHRYTREFSRRAPPNNNGNINNSYVSEISARNNPYPH